MKLKKLRNSKPKIISLSLIIVILLANFISVPPIPKISDGLAPDYLYEYLPGKTSYRFNAEGECHVIAEVKGTDFSSFSIDDEQYEVSYGFNTIPINFSEGVHNITLENNNYFRSVTIEPIFIAQGNETVGLNAYKVIEFDAGGMISILLKPNFSYNLLYVNLDDNVLKRKYDTIDYPEIDSQLYSYFAEGGSYIRFDIDVHPGRYHNLQLGGNGSVEYIIMVNDDWDEDDIPDVLEVQKQEFNGFHDLDPTIPNIWGFFEKSEAVVLINTSETNDPLEGYFSYHIPKPGTYFLTIEVEEGEYFDFDFDGDSVTLNNTVLKGNTTNNRVVVKVYDWGWHYISYRYRSNYNKIKFFLSGPYKEIIVLNIPELIDSDGDGVKDFEERNDNLKYQGSDSDGDGLPDNFDNSPFAFLKLDKNKINRFIIPTNPDKNSMISVQIKKPNKDYSTKGIPRLWRDTINVSINPALRLFGNRYKLFGDSPVLPLTISNTSYLWDKSFNTYNLVRGYNSREDVVGDALPNPRAPNNETWYVFPSIAEETWEFEFKFLKDNPAKSDNVLDIRFDFIWFITSYENQSTDILHYYNFEEDIILQALTMREIGDISYLLATPDNFVENQILWTLLQNPTIGTFEEFGVYDDLVGNGTVDFSEITEQISSDIENYYKNQTERNIEAEVSYFSGFQDSYDLLNKYTLSLNNSLDSPLLNRRDFQSKYSYYSINNVYKDEDIQMGDPEVTGDYKINYYITQNIFNISQQVATLSDLPIAMEKKNFPNSNSNILEITSAISEAIPLNEIPIPIPSTLMHPKIKLKKLTYIEQNNIIEQIPKVNFDMNTDIEKCYFDNRAHECDQGELFFESDSVSPSQAVLFVNSIDSFRVDLKNLHDLYKYFNTAEGLEICSADIFDPYRHIDNLLNNYVDDDGQYFLKILEISEPTIKLEKIWLIGDIMVNCLGLQTVEFIDRMVSMVSEAFSDGLYRRLGKLTKGLKLNRAHFEFKKTKFNVAKNIGWAAYSGKDTRWGRFKGKFSYQIDKLKYALKIDQIGAIVNLAMAGYKLYQSIADLMKVMAKGPAGEDQYNTTMWVCEMTISICNVVLATMSLISGAIKFAEVILKITTKALDSLKSFCSGVAAAVGILLVVIDWVQFVTKVQNGEYSGRELLFQTISIIANTAVAALGFALAIACSSTGYGAALGVAIALLTILGMWLSQELNQPSIDVQNCSMYFNDATKLNMRRHGGLEVGDDINYYVKVKNDGKTDGWVRGRFRLQENESGGWESNWDGWYGVGDWYDDLWPWEGPWGHAPFPFGGVWERSFSATIPQPTTNLHYHFDLEFDWERFELIICVPTLWRTEGLREYFTQKMRMPALDNTISDFYDDTNELMSTTLLKKEFERAINEYRWKDASDIAKEVISRTESQAKTPSDELYRLNAGKRVYNDSYYLYHTNSSDEFHSLIESHYESGIIAKVLIPEEIWHPNRALGPKMRHMLSYNYSEGDILIPRDEENWINDWFYIKFQELGDAALYSQLLQDLPIRTNIRTDLRGNPLSIDPDTKICYANFQLYLEGPDNPDVKFTISPPGNFSVMPSIFTQNLRNNISFTITQDNPRLLMGLYYFEMNISINNKIIYSTSLPIRVEGFIHIDYVAHIPLEPIKREEIFNLLDVVNLGTLPSSVILTIDGIPEHFLYKDLYPEEFINNTQYFNTLPGDSRPSVVICPYCCARPGIYEFNVTAINPYDNSTYFIYEGSFEIEGFPCNCSNPDVLNYDKTVYNLEIVNIGSVNEQLAILHNDIDFVSYSNDQIMNSENKVTTVQSVTKYLQESTIIYCRNR